MRRSWAAVFLLCLTTVSLHADFLLWIDRPKKRNNPNDRNSAFFVPTTAPATAVVPATSTPTYTPVNTSTNTPSFTVVVNISTPTPTATPTRTITLTATPSASPSNTPSPTPTATPKYDGMDPGDNVLGGANNINPINTTLQTTGTHYVGYGADAADYYVATLNVTGTYNLTLNLALGTGTVEIRGAGDVLIFGPVSGGLSGYSPPGNGSYYIVVRSTSGGTDYTLSYQDVSSATATATASPMPTLTRTPTASPSNTPMAPTATPTAGAPCTALYNFESGVEGWMVSGAGGVGVSQSATQADCGTGSLALALNIAGANSFGAAQISNPAIVNNGCKIITARVWVPAGMSGDAIGAQFFALTGPSYDWNAAWTTLPNAGGWTTVTLDLTGVTGIIQQVGIQINEGSPPGPAFAGTVYIDNVRVSDSPACGTPTPTPTPGGCNAFYNFETNAEGWTFGDPGAVSVAQSTLQADCGMGSLALNVNLTSTNNASAQRDNPAVVNNGCKMVTARVWVPAGFSQDIAGAQLFAQYGTGWTWISNAAPLPNAGGWVSLSLNLSGISATINRIGVQFFLGGPPPAANFAGTFYIDKVDIVDDPSCGATLTPTPVLSTATFTATPTQTPMVATATPTDTPTPMITDIGFSWSPQFITVTAGTTVTWGWAGFHDVTSDTGAFGPSATGNNLTFSYTFNTPGTYGYHCSIHGGVGSGMYGVVYVIGADSPTPTPVITATNTPLPPSPTHTATNTPTGATATPTSTPVTCTALYSFESSVQGWVVSGAGGVSVSQSVTQADCGTGSLALALNIAGANSQGAAQISNPAIVNNGCKTITARVWVPAGMSGDAIGAQFFALTGPSYDWNASWTTLPNAGGWTTVTLDLTGVTGVIQQVGIQINEGSPPGPAFAGTVYIDNVQVSDSPACGTPTPTPTPGGCNAFYNFETGTEAWVAAGNASGAVQSSAQADCGSNSLALTINISGLNSQGAGQVSNPVFVNNGCTVITARVWVPAGMSGDATGAQFFALTGPSYDWNASWTTLPDAGGWTIVTLDLTGVTGTIQQVGIQFNTGGAPGPAFNGTVYIDRVDLIDNPSCGATPTPTPTMGMPTATHTATSTALAFTATETPVAPTATETPLVPTPTSTPVTCTALYSFESSVQGWVVSGAGGVSVSQSVTQADCGTGSLALALNIAGANSQGAAQISNPAIVNNGCKTITARVWVPAGMSGDAIGAQFFALTGPSYDWNASWTTLPNAGGWTTVTLDLTGVTGVIQQVGIQINEGSPPGPAFAGTVYIDNVQVSDSPACGTPTPTPTPGGCNAFYNFETGTEAWVAAGNASGAVQSSAQADCGSNSLALTINISGLNSQGAGQVSNPVFVNNGCTVITARVWVPAGMSGDATGAQFFALTGPSYDWNASWTTLPDAGGWTIVTLDLTGVTGTIQQVGIQFNTGGAPGPAFNGTVYIDRVDLTSGC